MKYPKGNPTDWIRRVAKPGDVIIDGGANAGGFTRAAAETVGPTGKVYAVEPDPRCAAALTELQDTYEQVTFVPAALSKTTAAVTLHQAHKPEQSSLVLGAVSDPIAALQVPAVTLDGIAPKRVAAVKLDLQGGEVIALLGAPNLLGRCPLWCVELWPWAMRRAGLVPESAANWLIWVFAGFDYTFRTMDAGYPETRSRDLLDWCLEDHAENEHINIVFTHV